MRSQSKPRVGFLDTRAVTARGRLLAGAVHEVQGSVTMEPPQSDLVRRLRLLLATEPSTREVSMFGGLSFMVNNKMVVSAGKHGDLLTRIPAERHDELTARPGAARAEMGAGRSMGPGWISVSAASIDTTARLSFWLEAALDYNRTATGKR